jgi:hypothetical protein
LFTSNILSVRGWYFKINFICTLKLRVSPGKIGASRDRFLIIKVLPGHKLCSLVKLKLQYRFLTLINSHQKSFMSVDKISHPGTKKNFTWFFLTRVLTTAQEKKLSSSS